MLIISFLFFFPLPILADNREDVTKISEYLFTIFSRYSKLNVYVSLYFVLLLCRYLYVSCKDSGNNYKLIC